MTPGENIFLGGSECLRTPVSLCGLAAAGCDGLVDRGNPVRGSFESARGDLPAGVLVQFQRRTGHTANHHQRSQFSHWGNGFTVQTPMPRIFPRWWVRDGAVTHAFDMDQRLVGLSFTASGSSLMVTAPPNGNIAPPGYYMLFVLNNSGVPSVAKFIQLIAGGGGNPAPTLSSYQPDVRNNAWGHCRKRSLGQDLWRERH